MNYDFYGFNKCENIKPIINIKINNPIDLYNILLEIWSEYTCAPRLRSKWNINKKTVGQCSITAFLVQDIFGGDVYGTLVGNNLHCFNVIDGITFDLTSSQFDEELNYEKSNLQLRDNHFSKQEKYERYLYLKEKLYEYLNM